MREFLRAIQLLTKEQKLRRFVWRPVLWGLAAYGACLLLAVFLGSALSDALIPEGAPTWLSRGTGAAAGALILIVFGGPIFAALLSLASSFHWDALAKEIGEREGLDLTRPGLTGGQMALEIGLRLSFTVSGVAASAIFFLFGQIWIGALISGLVGWADFTAAISQRQGVAFPGSYFRAIKRKGSLPIIGLAALCSLVPLLYAFVLPVFAAAGCLVAGDRLGERRA